MSRCPLLLTVALTGTTCCAQAGFVPELAEADVLPRVVRPGDVVSVTFRFRNAGDRVAPLNYFVFLHFEDPVQGCTRIVWQYDHPPTEPTSFWLPGGIVVDGPLQIRVPAETAPAEYSVHVGLFSPDTGRVLDTHAGTVTVDPEAPAVPVKGPEPLPEAEVARRRAAAERLTDPVRLDTATYTFAIEPDSGRYLLTDKRAGVSWGSNPLQDRFGRLALRNRERVEPVVITGLQLVERAADRLVLAKPIELSDGRPSGLTLRVTLQDDPRPPGGVRISYEATGQGDWQVERVWLLDNALVATEADGGRTVDPHRLGRPNAAADGLPNVSSGTTYSGATMQMLSLEKQGAALLVTWDHVDVSYRVQRLWLDEPRVPGRRALLHTVELAGGARDLWLRPLGPGDYVSSARAYRDVAARQGWRVTRAERAATHPAVEALAGAADFKPFTLSRTIPGSRYHSGEGERTYLGYTFEETADLAEHWHRVLGIDRAMVVLAGWIHRGYDNQHPDILPAAPECGGNDALAAAGRRIRDCGFLFGLHDNYQDMYEDAPSWNVAMLRKDRNGRPLMGGNWAGGQAWQVRPQSQLELAQRNLPEVKRLFGPTIYFIDTTFAWGLVNSEDPNDPWDRTVDLDYKSRLCAYAREQMGAFGSEEGREWAVPVADYLEGLLGDKYDAAPGEVLPIFNIAYHDCVSTYTHQGVRLGPDDDKHVLDTLIYGEMPLYNFGPHRYWEHDLADPVPLRVSAVAEPAGPRSFRITYRWHVLGPLTENYSCFVHFTNPRGEREGIIFQNDHALPPTSQWQPGQTYTDGPHTVEVPEGELGDFDALVGLLDGNQRRQSLAMRAAGGQRYRVGRVIVGRGALRFEAIEAAGPARPFARNEGWARGLCPTDRFIKNTYEVFTWVHRLTFSLPLEEHHVEGLVERTRFGDDVRIVCNYGGEPVEVETNEILGRVRLGPYGFVVWSSTFVAVHAEAAAGKNCPTPVLFTARSLDGKPLAESAQVRIFHGFGGPELKLGPNTFVVEREEVVRL